MSLFTTQYLEIMNAEETTYLKGLSLLTYMSCEIHIANRKELIQIQKIVEQAKEFLRTNRYLGLCNAIKTRKQNIEERVRIDEDTRAYFRNRVAEGIKKCEAIKHGNSSLSTSTTQNIKNNNQISSQGITRQNNKFIQKMQRSSTPERKNQSNSIFGSCINTFYSFVKSHLRLSARFGSRMEDETDPEKQSIIKTEKNDCRKEE